MSLTNLQSKGIIITGGAGYLGRSYAQGLCQQGADVVLVDHDQEKLDAAVAAIEKSISEGTVRPFRWDLADQENFDQSSESLCKMMNRIDVLINNAAFVGTSNLTGWVDDFENQSIETFNAALHLNLLIPFHLSQKFYPKLKEHNNGSIINIGSLYATVGPDMALYEDIKGMGNPAAYAASKGGLLQLSRWLSTVMAPDVRVNMVSPGGIFRNQDQRFVDRFVARTPMGRMATEEDNVGAIVFFSSAMSKYITGQNLSVDGGYTTM